MLPPRKPVLISEQMMSTDKYPCLFSRQVKVIIYYIYYKAKWLRLVILANNLLWCLTINFAARIVSGTRKFDHVTPILKQLQWLPIIKQLAVSIFVWSLKSDRKCTIATLGTAYIYHYVGRLQVSVHLLSEAKSYGIVSQTSFSLSLF